MKYATVIARSTSDAAIHKYHSAPPWIATACGLAMTGGEGMFMESEARQSMPFRGAPRWIVTACGLAMTNLVLLR
jgi:hypothetical protein